MARSIFLMQKLKTKNHQRRGSILVEAILAIIILAICLTLIIQSMTGSLRASKYAGDYTLAVIAAENEMFDRIEKSFIASGIRDTTTDVVAGRSFDTQIETQAVVGAENDKINQVSLDVKWISGKRKNQFGVFTYLLDPSSEKKKEK